MTAVCWRRGPCLPACVLCREFTMGCGTPLLLRPAVSGVQVARVKSSEVRARAQELCVGQVFSITVPTTVTTPDPSCAHIEVVAVAVDRDPRFCARLSTPGVSASVVRWRPVVAEHAAGAGMKKRALAALATTDCPMFAGERREPWTRSGRSRRDQGPESRVTSK